MAPLAALISASLRRLRSASLMARHLPRARNSRCSRFSAALTLIAARVRKKGRKPLPPPGVQLLLVVPFAAISDFGEWKVCPLAQEHLQPEKTIRLHSFHAESLLVFQLVTQFRSKVSDSGDWTVTGHSLFSLTKNLHPCDKRY